MYVSDIEEVVKLFRKSLVSTVDNDAVTGKANLTKTVRIEPKYSIVRKMDDLKEGSVDLTKDEIDYLKETIPDICSDYIHHNGRFFFIGYDVSTLVLCEKKPENAVIFDYNHTDFYNLSASVQAALTILESALYHYNQNCIYKDSNYTLIQPVEIPNEHYDNSCSLTKEESKELGKKQVAHNKKYHKKGFGYQGASPVSNFEVRFGACSIGSWCDCVCTACEKERNRLVNEGAPKKEIEKLEKQMTIEVRGIE